MIKMRVEETTEPDLTPMIDVVFQLIIFFMVIMAIAVVYGVAIKFPQASNNKASSNTKQEKNIIVYVQSDLIDQGHHLVHDGTMKINGEEFSLTKSTDPNLWEEEREKAFEWLRWKMGELVKAGHKKDVLIIQGDMRTYHGKILRVVDQGKHVGIEGFSLVPPTQ